MWPRIICWIWHVYGTQLHWIWNGKSEGQFSVAFLWDIFDCPWFNPREIGKGSSYCKPNLSIKVHLLISKIWLLILPSSAVVATHFLVNQNLFLLFSINVGQVGQELRENQCSHCITLMLIFLVYWWQCSYWTRNN